MMKKVNFILIVFLLVLLTGCGKEKYYIPKNVLEILEVDASEFSKGIREVSLYDGTYEDVYADKEGNLVFVADDEQINAFIDLYKSDFEYYKYVLTKNGMEFEYNESYTEIVLKCKKDDFGEKLTEEDLIFLVGDVSWCQALTGVKPENLYVQGYIKDIETGEVLYEYILTSEE